AWTRDAVVPVPARALRPRRRSRRLCVWPCPRPKPKARIAAPVQPRSWPAKPDPRSLACRVGAVVADPDPGWLEGLSGLLSIEGIRPHPARPADVRRAGEWVRDFIRRAGGEAELVETETFPLAVGEIRASGGGE